MKRQRGLKRYYKNLLIKVDFDKIKSVDFNDPRTWFDNWHIHFDRYGYGNYSFKKRKPHLDKLFRHFEILADKTKEIKTDFQLYAIILDYDSKSDAIFLNTLNPNVRKKPFNISELKTESNLTNKQLDDYIKSLSGFEILYGGVHENFCLIYKENVGQHLK
jgi:hypothetical protein